MSRAGIGGIFKRISSIFARRVLVGKDKAGNLYYKRMDCDMSGTDFERRIMVPGNRSAPLRGTSLLQISAT